MSRESFVPLVPLACECEVVTLKQIPDELFLPGALSAPRPWLHEALEGYYTAAKRFLRVTRRGTVLFTMIRAVVREVGGEEFIEEIVDEEVVGTLYLQDICALLPVYDIETGIPFVNMAVLARYVSERPSKSKIVGEGTSPVLIVAMAAEDLEKLATLVLSYGPHATSRLVNAYKEARPIRVATIKDGHHRADDSTAKPPLSVDSGGASASKLQHHTAPAVTAAAAPTMASHSSRSGSHVATSHSSRTAVDSDDEDLAAALFGGPPPKSQEGLTSAAVTSAATGSADVTIDPDEDRDLLIALGMDSVPPSVRSTSKSAMSAQTGGKSAASHLTRTVSFGFGLEVRSASTMSTSVVGENAAILNPFKMGIGTLPPRVVPRMDTDIPFELAFAHREATVVTSEAVADFLERNEQLRRQQYEQDRAAAAEALQLARTRTAALLRLESLVPQGLNHIQERWRLGQAAALGATMSGLGNVRVSVGAKSIAGSVRAPSNVTTTATTAAAPTSSGGAVPSAVQHSTGISDTLTVASLGLDARRATTATSPFSSGLRRF